MIMLHRLVYTFLRYCGEFATIIVPSKLTLRRITLRLLQSEVVKDGNLDYEILDQLCTIFESASNQAKASRRRPSTPEQGLFTKQELEWFSKTSYNVSLKYCAVMPPRIW
jgi:hypothetical protein